MNTTTIGGLRYFWIAALVAIGVATTIASGGGGGSGGSVEPPPPTGGPTLTITAANGTAVSSAVLVSIGASFDLADISRIDLVLPAAAGWAAPSRSSSLQGFGAQAGVLANCPNGGTVDITETVADPTKPTIGDRIVAVFTDCDNNDGYVISGTVDLTIAALQGDPLTDVFLVGFETLLTDVVVTEGTFVFTADGDFLLTYDSLDFPVLTITLAGTSLQVGENSLVATLSNFDHSLSVDMGVFPDTKLADALGRLQSTALGGSVDYVSTVSIQAIGDFNPHTGEILISGAGGSSVKIVVVDSLNVRLEIDTNGDGTIDQFVDTSWSELTGETTPAGGSAITSDNVSIVAREVFNAVTGFGSVTVAAGGQFAPSGVFALVQQQGVSGDFGPLTIDCATSGTADVSGSIATAGTYTAGDGLDASFAACIRASEKLDGAMQLTVESFSGTVGAAVSIAANVTETNLRRGADGTCHIGLGSFATSYDAGFVNPGFVTAGSTAVAFDISAGGRHQILSNASVSALIQIGQPATVTRESFGSFIGTDLVGSFSYMSLAPDVFVVDGDPSTGPSSGELLVIAGNGSTMRLVAVDNLTVRLDADYNADSTIDAQLFTTWAELGYGNVFGICDLDPVP